MGLYHLNSPGKNRLQVFNEKKELLTELRREGCMHYNTSFTYKGEQYRFVNENIWHSRFVLQREGEAIAHISWRWTGAAFIEVQNESGEWYCFELKGNGFFDYTQSLVDEFRESLLTIRPETNWNCLSYRLSLEGCQPEKSPVDFVWLLSIALFSNMITMSNWGVSIQTGGAAIIV